MGDKVMKSLITFAASFAALLGSALLAHADGDFFDCRTPDGTKLDIAIGWVANIPISSFHVKIRTPNGRVYDRNEQYDDQTYLIKGDPSDISSYYRKGRAWPRGDYQAIGELSNQGGNDWTYQETNLNDGHVIARAGCKAVDPKY
jgi:hypothetical protein